LGLLGEFSPGELTAIRRGVAGLYIRWILARRRLRIGSNRDGDTDV
jgi:hypothetical protein